MDNFPYLMESCSVEYYKSCFVIISVELSKCFSVNIFIKISGVEKGIFRMWYILNGGGRSYFKQKYVIFAIYETERENSASLQCKPSI